MSAANHHLWLNRKSWWVAFTVIYDGYRQERVRRSLGTRDVQEARVRRDELIEQFRRTAGCELRIRHVPAVPGRQSPRGG